MNRLSTSDTVLSTVKFKDFENEVKTNSSTSIYQEYQKQN